jgi:hypothetical protein
MRKLVLILVAVSTFGFFGCENAASPQAEAVNPLIGTWKQNVIDPNYPETAATATLIFTETEFSYSYKWTVSGNENMYKGGYIYTDTVIFFIIDEANEKEVERYANHIYRIFNNDKLYLGMGLFHGETYLKSP